MAALLALSACQPSDRDDPLVIRDDDPLKAFMFPASRDMSWTYRRETVGLIEETATVSIAVEALKKDAATLSVAVEGSDSAEIVQGLGLLGDAAIDVRADGAVQVTDRQDELTYYPDGRVTSKDGVVYELIGTELLQTPAGPFACVKYRVRRDPSVDFPMTLDGTQWWGKGAGLVKAVSTVTGFNSGTRTTIELIALEK
jgi:hypothetical protein